MQGNVAEVVKEVFPEERRKVVSWLREQKRHLRFWTVLTIALFLVPIVARAQDVLAFAASHARTLTDVLFFSWLIVSIFLSFVWPQKPGDFFRDRFRAGINPSVWDYEGEWRVEPDEDGRNVLSVTRSERGGIALPCLAWTDYELQFDTRIINKATAWLVRASSLNDSIMFQLSTKTLFPHYRISGLWLPFDQIEHNLPIIAKEWMTVKTLVRGPWATIYVTLQGQQHRIFQDRIAGTPPPVTVQIGPEALQMPATPSRQVISTSFRTGSFGFRLSTDEHAHFRNVQAYRFK